MGYMPERGTMKTPNQSETAGAAKTAETSSASTTQTAQPVAAASPSKAFTGAYIEGGLRVVIETPDPMSTKMVRTRQRFDKVTDVVITNVVGHGHFTNTNEPYVSVYGQYAPGKTIRLTAASQYYDAVRKLLSGNVDNEKADKPLKKPITVIASGEKMRGHGLLVNGLWLVKEDGSRETIVVPQGAIIEGSGAEPTVESALL